MLFGNKVVFNGPRLWFHDPEGRPLFGILRGDAALLAKEASGGLCLSVMHCDTGWGRIELNEDDIRQIHALANALANAISAQSE